MEHVAGGWSPCPAMLRMVSQQTFDTSTLALIQSLLHLLHQQAKRTARAALLISHSVLFATLPVCPVCRNPLQYSPLIAPSPIASPQHPLCSNGCMISCYPGEVEVGCGLPSRSMFVFGLYPVGNSPQSYKFIRHEQDRHRYPCTVR